MARVTGKYDVGFERGEGGFSSVFGTYIGTRLKENKEQYAREIKAADPTNEYKILKDLMDERRKIVSDMSRLKASASGGGTVSYSTTQPSGKDWAKYQDKQEEINRERGKQFHAGIQSAGIIANELFEAVLSKDMSVENKRKLTEEVLEKATKSGAQYDDFNSGIAAGMSAVVEEAFKNNHIDENTANKLRVDLATKANLSAEDIKRFEDPSYLSPSQMARKPLYMQPSTRTTTSRKQMGAGVDPSELASFYTKRLQQLDSMIADQTEKYQTASAEYKQLVKGPGRNLALAPLSSRPSALSQSLSKYGRLREVDPSYAREAMTASEEEGKFVLPTPYEELTSIKGAGGESPVNFLLNQAELMRDMRGFARGKETGEFELRDLTKEEADLVEGSVSQMLTSLDSPLYQDAKYGGVREILERHKKAFKVAEESGFDSAKVIAANSLADEMSGWEGSMSQDEIVKMTKKDHPASRVADSIRESQKAYDEFLQTRDAEQYRAKIAKTYNDLLNTPEDVRGLVGDAYLNEIERYESVDPSRRLPEELNFKLQGLAQSADEIAARSVLKPGYEGELPETGPRSKTADVVGLGSEIETGD